MKMIPSLSLPGNAEEAMKFYADALQGEIKGTMRYEDVPGDIPNTNMLGKVIHGEVVFEGGTLFFSDNFMYEVVSGNQLELTLDCNSEEQLMLFFDGLKKDAKNVSMEPQATFWGGIYAQLTDKYGTGWGLNFQKEPLPK
jgi:PhnB protein